MGYTVVLKIAMASNPDYKKEVLEIPATHKRQHSQGKLSGKQDFICILPFVGKG